MLSNLLSNLFFSRLIRPPFRMMNVSTNEGVPGIFRTYRQETIAKLYELLFRESYKSVLFIRAPPLSGKTGIAQLLCLRIRENPNRSVVFLSCQDMNIENGENFNSFFYRMVKCPLDVFLARPEERVIILDEAQCAYVDDNFWRVIVKGALNANHFPGLRIILLASFGSFNPYRVSAREGTPIAIPKENTVGLYDTYLQAGLFLKLSEFKEMIAGTQFEPHEENIWALCSNHIGIASAILNHLDNTLRSLGPITSDQVMSALYSKSLLQTLSRYSRGMPTLASFSKLVQGYCRDLSTEDVARLKKILHRVAMGELLTSDDQARSPGSSSAVDLLLKYGFLFEDERHILCFASQMHLKVWLDSNRLDCFESLVNISLYDFIVLAIGRMSSNRLQQICHQNGVDVVRERQIQMELYAAIVSLAHRNVYVTPEWRTADKKGYVDLVVRFENNQNQTTLWFLELLVDGVGAKEHSERFDIGGKYQTSLTSYSNYALIDFRQNIAPRNLKDEFIYVSFSGDFMEAILQSSEKTQTVELLS